MVGIPVLASERLPEGATAFGLLMSAFAGGNFFGYLFAGSLPRPDASRMRWIMILLFAWFGVVIGSFLGRFWIITSSWLGKWLCYHPPHYLDTDPHSQRDARANDGFVDVIQYRANPHLAGNRRRIKQMEPDFIICITRYVGLTDDSLDQLPTRI